MKSVSGVLLGFGLVLCFFLITYVISSNLLLTSVLSIALIAFTVAIVFKIELAEGDGEYTLDKSDDQDDSKGHFQLNDGS